MSLLIGSTQRLALCRIGGVAIRKRHVDGLVKGRQMRSEGVIHLFGHVQRHVATTTKVPPGGEGDRQEEAGEKGLLCGIGRHFFVFLDGKIRGAGKDEIVPVFETGKVHGLGGLEQELDGGGGLHSGDHVAIGGGQTGVGIDADVGDAEGQGGQGAPTPSRTEIQDAVFGLEVEVYPLGHDGAELVNGPVIKLEDVVLCLQEMLCVIGGEGLFLVSYHEFGEMGFDGGVFHRIIKGEMATGLGLETMGEEKIVERGEARAAGQVFFGGLRLF